jgi:hypothetical protein
VKAIVRKVLRAAIFVSPPFVIAIVVLVLSLAGIIALDPRISWRSVLIANAVLYWMVAAVALAIVLDFPAVLAVLRAHRGQLVMLAISLGVSLVFAELVAKVIVAGSHGWQLIPSTRYHHVNPTDVSVLDNTGSRVTTNADGFRTSWTRETFLGQHERIAVIGDSFAFGLGVNDEETAPSVLQNLLRERLARDDVGVLNAGVISWSPIVQRRAFREIVAEYRPTVTLLLLDATDVGDDYNYGLSVVPGSDPESPDFSIDNSPHAQPPALTTLAGPILEYLRAPYVVARRFSSRPPRSSSYYQFELMIGGVLETNRWFILRHPLELTRPYFETTLSYIRQIARDAESRGSKFMLVVTPRYFHWNDEECPEDWASDQRDNDEPHEYAMFEFFDEAAKRESFPIVSLLPAFQATDRFPLVLHNDAHWNPDGNRFVAETLADLLLERGLVTGAPAR